MYKNILGVAAIIAATAVLIHSLPSATAQGLGPVVSGAELPWVSFTGNVNVGATKTAYTVPSDRVFVLTGVQCGYWSSSYAHKTTCPEIRENSTTKNPLNLPRADQDGFLSKGNGRVVFAPGTSVVLDNDYSVRLYYFMNGYLARP